MLNLIKSYSFERESYGSYQENKFNMVVIQNYHLQFMYLEIVIFRTKVKGIIKNAYGEICNDQYLHNIGNLLNNTYTICDIT